MERTNPNSIDSSAKWRITETVYVLLNQHPPLPLLLVVVVVVAFNIFEDMNEGNVDENDEGSGFDD